MEGDGTVFVRPQIFWLMLYADNWITVMTEVS